jgi:GNAT superfamily N-acetyltransferase
VKIRHGQQTDAEAVLALWDAAIAWLVIRGQPGQWGVGPASARPQSVDLVHRWSAGAGLRIAELDGETIGASVIASARPDYVPAISRREMYLLFLVTDRARRGQGIGNGLVRQAKADARAAGSQVLRVDCWAGAPDLVAWYERQGFVRTETFEVNNGWCGQVFAMAL